MKKLGFGAMRLPVIDKDDAKVDIEKFKEMADLFLKRGFTYFDTSYVYHGGKSESAIKEAVVDRYPRGQFYHYYKTSYLSASGAKRCETALPGTAGPSGNRLCRLLLAPCPEWGNV